MGSQRRQICTNCRHPAAPPPSALLQHYLLCLMHVWLSIRYTSCNRCLSSNQRRDPQDSAQNILPLRSAPGSTPASSQSSIHHQERAYGGRALQHDANEKSLRVPIGEYIPSGEGCSGSLTALSMRSKHFISCTPSVCISTIF